MRPIIQGWVHWERIVQLFRSRQKLTTNRRRSDRWAQVNFIYTGWINTTENRNFWNVRNLSNFRINHCYFMISFYNCNSVLNRWKARPANFSFVMHWHYIEFFHKIFRFQIIRGPEDEPMIVRHSGFDKGVHLNIGGHWTPKLPDPIYIPSQVRAYISVSECA